MEISLKMLQKIGLPFKDWRPVKELGVGTVISKATSELHGKILEKLGADQVIFPDRESARRLARGITGGEAPAPAPEEG